MDVPPEGPTYEWGASLIRVYNLDIPNLLNNYQNMGQPTKAPLYTVSQLTTSNYSISGAPRPTPGRFAFCENAFGSPALVPVFSDGVYWRRVSNNAVIS